MHFVCLLYKHPVAIRSYLQAPQCMYTCHVWRFPFSIKDRQVKLKWFWKAYGPQKIPPPQTRHATCRAHFYHTKVYIMRKQTDLFNTWITEQKHFLNSSSTVELKHLKVQVFYYCFFFYSLHIFKRVYKMRKTCKEKKKNLQFQAVF